MRNHLTLILWLALVVALVALWALRLSAYITWRNWGEGEDALPPAQVDERSHFEKRRHAVRGPCRPSSHEFSPGPS